MSIFHEIERKINILIIKLMTNKSVVMNRVVDDLIIDEEDDLLPIRKSPNRQNSSSSSTSSSSSEPPDETGLVKDERFTKKGMCMLLVLGYKRILDAYKIVKIKSL